MQNFSGLSGLGKPIREDQKENFPRLIEYLNKLEYNRDKIHQIYPYLYPDDVERLSNKHTVEKLAKYKDIPYLNESRRDKLVDSSNFCTCPKEVSKKL